MKKQEKKLKRLVREIIKEGSGVTSDRMLRSLYDKMKEEGRYELNPLDKENLLFRFKFDDIVEGSIEAREGQILISFNQIVIPPTQVGLKYDGDVVLAKDTVWRKISSKVVRRRNFIQNLK